MKNLLYYIIGAICVFGLVILTSKDILTSTLNDDEMDLISDAIVQNTVTLFDTPDVFFSELDLIKEYIVKNTETITLLDNGSTSSSKNVDISNNIITISRPGTYIIDGTLNEGQIIVDAFLSSDVQLVLNGASISNSQNPPIYVEKTGKTYVTTVKNTENTIISYRSDAIFSNHNITLNGDGILNVTSFDGDGVKSQKSIASPSGIYNINASNNGLNAVSTILIGDALYKVEAENSLFLTSNDDGAVIFEGSFIGVCNNDNQQLFCDEKSKNSSVLIPLEDKNSGEFTISSNDNVIFNFYAEKDFSYILISSPEVLSDNDFYVSFDNFSLKTQ